MKAGSTLRLLRANTLGSVEPAQGIWPQWWRRGARVRAVLGVPRVVKGEQEDVVRVMPHPVGQVDEGREQRPVLGRWDRQLYV